MVKNDSFVSVCTNARVYKTIRITFIRIKSNYYEHIYGFPIICSIRAVCIYIYDVYGYVVKYRQVYCIISLKILCKLIITDT